MKSEDTSDNTLGFVWLISVVLYIILILSALLSCAPVAEIYDSNGNIPMGFGLPEDTIYIEPHNWRGVYEIRDTVIVDTFLIGAPCE